MELIRETPSDGYGSGSGYGDGDGDGSGDGSGYGSGSGYGDGDGDGSGDGSGYGHGFDHGYGDDIIHCRPITKRLFRVSDLHGACREEVEIFERVFPNGALYPDDLAKAADAGLNLKWAQENLGILLPK